MPKRSHIKPWVQTKHESTRQNTEKLLALSTSFPRSCLSDPLEILQELHNDYGWVRRFSRRPCTVHARHIKGSELVDNYDNVAMMVSML